MEPSVRSMQTLHSTPGALRVLAISIIARLPLAMLGIGLLVQAVHLTGSFTAAGVVAGANAIAIGVCGPVLGKLVDRRGQTLVLITSGCASGSRSNCIVELNSLASCLRTSPSFTPVVFSAQTQSLPRASREGRHVGF